MAYGLKYYFVDKKIVGSTTTTYKFEILEDGHTGGSTEWIGVDISRQYEELSFRKLNYLQKSTCNGTIRVEDTTQRGIIETIGGSQIGDYKVQLKKNGTIVWTGLVIPDLTVIGEENYGNQSASIHAKDIFIKGDFPLTTIFPDTRGIEKAIVLIADILDTMGYQLDIVSYTSWIEGGLTQTDDILNQSYHEKERFRIYGKNDDEDDRPLTNQQALEYILKSYGLILRQVNGDWNLVQITAYDNISSVRRYVYDYEGTQTSSTVSHSMGTSTGSDNLYIQGSSSNNYFAGVKKVASNFKHDSIIQGIKFNREYWIDDASELAKSQYWQADGTGNIELFFVTWFAKTTATDLGNPVVMSVSIYVDTGGTDYYWNGTAWVTSPATINVEVQESYSSRDSDNNYIHKNAGITIVTDPIPDAADGTLNVKITPDPLAANYAYWYLRSLDFKLTYSDTVDGISSAINYELEQTGDYSDEYDYGSYYFGDGPTSASLSALKNSSRALLALWKRYGDTSTTNHQNLILNEILNVRRNQRRNIRASLYGEYEPDDILVYDSSNFFFLGGSWSSKSYQWSGNFIQINIQEGTDTLNTFYITDGSGISSGAIGSTGETTGASSLYLEKGKNLSDIPSDVTARANIGLGSTDQVIFATVNTGQGDNELYGMDQDVKTTDDVQFDDITATGVIRTNELDAQADLVWNTAEEVWNTSDYYFTGAINLAGSLYITDELDVAESLTVGTTLDVSGNTSLGGTLDVTGNSTVGGALDITSDTTVGGSLTLTGSADFNSTMNLQGDLTTQADLKDDGYSPSWSGSNWQIQADGTAEFQELFVRGALTVYEFIAKQISTIGGSEILSIAQGKVESTTIASGAISFENTGGAPGISFKAGDLWICQVTSINQDKESGGSGTIVKSVTGQVSLVSGTGIVVSVTSGSLSDISKGDLIVAYGNVSDEDRQAIMYRNVDRSADSLIMRMQTEVDEFSDLQNEANTRIAFGDLGPRPSLSTGYSGLTEETFGFFAGDNTNEHILVHAGNTSINGGLFLKDGATVLAQLTGNTFKVGDSTNFLSFNGSAFNINTNTFSLDTTASGGGIDIDSTTQTIKLEDSNKVRTQVDITNGSPSVSVDVNQSISAQTITDLSAYETTAGTYYNVDLGDAVEVFVTASLTTLTNAGGGTFIVYLYGGNSSTSATNELARKRSQIISSGSTSLYVTAYSYTYDYFKVRIEADIDNPGTPPPTPAVTFTTSTFTVKSYESQTRIALDGVYVNNDSTQYARLTRDSNKLSGLTILENLPTGDPEIAGALYNDNGTIKISAG